MGERLTEAQVKKKMATSAPPWERDPAFQAEFRRWNKILASSGLADIESHAATKGGSSTSTPFIKGHYLETRAAVMRGALGGKREFYALAEEWVELATYRSLRERWAWGAVARGESIRAAGKRFRCPDGRLRLQSQLMLAFAKDRAAKEGAADPTLDLEWQDAVDALIDGEIEL